MVRPIKKDYSTAVQLQLEVHFFVSDGYHEICSHRYGNLIGEGRGDSVGDNIFLRNYLKMSRTSLYVIPAKAGIQVFRGVLDPGFRRGDGVNEF